MKRTMVVATVFVLFVFLLLLAVGSGLRQLPTHSEEAKGHVEAIKELISSLKQSLPPVEPIVEASSRATAWSEQKRASGKISINPADAKDMAQQLKTIQNAVGKMRASWTAAEAEANSHAATLEAMLNVAVWPDQLRGTLRALKDLLVILGWPVALLVVLTYILHSDRAKDRIGLIAKSIQRVALPGGFEVTLWGGRVPSRPIRDIPGIQGGCSGRVRQAGGATHHQRYVSPCSEGHNRTGDHQNN